MKLIACMMLLTFPVALALAQGRSGGRRSGGQATTRETESRGIGNTRSPRQQETPPRQKPVEKMQQPGQTPGNYASNPPVHENPVPCPPPVPPPEIEPVPWPIPPSPPSPGPNGFCILNGIRYGENVTLGDAYDMPEYSGFDFSQYVKVPFDDPGADFFVENDNGELLIRVRDDTEIMDIGLIDIPKNAIFILRKEWSASHEEPVMVNHEYVIRTWDHRYAKVKAVSVGEHRVVFNWAYQEGDGENTYSGMSRSFGSSIGFRR